MTPEEPVTEESALDLFLRLKAPWLFLRTHHCQEVNAILRDGIVKGEITELVGDIAVGKTQLCLSLVAKLLVNERHSNSHVVYMDTNGSFRSTRLLQILRHVANVSEGEVSALLSRVLICRVYDADDLKRALSAVEKRKEEISLVVIDSFGAALSETALNYIEGGRELQEAVIVRLRDLIRVLGCAVLTTNHFVYWKKFPAPSLGQKWISAVDSRYLMAKLPDSWYMQLIHSRRFQLTNERAFYKITERGIDSCLDDDSCERESQATNEIITQNWGTVMEIYSRNVASDDKTPVP